MGTIRRKMLLSLGLLLGGFTVPVRADMAVLRVAVLENSPPLSYRDAAGKLTGFSPAVAQALCDELAMRCEFRATRLEYLIDDLAAGHFDIAAVGLLNTPERSRKVLFTGPVYRSVALWIAKPGVEPGQAGVRVSVFKGSVHESYARARQWDVVAAQDESQMIEQLSAGVARAAVSPLMTSIGLQQNPALHPAGHEGHAAAGAGNGRQCLLRHQSAPRGFEGATGQGAGKIKRNGTYDRINSTFLPFRVE